MRLDVVDTFVDRLQHVIYLFNQSFKTFTISTRTNRNDEPGIEKVEQ